MNNNFENAQFGISETVNENFIVAPDAAANEIKVPQSEVGTRKILHIINGEHYSGAERVQDLLAKCLPDFGYEVGFACIKTDQFPEKRDCQKTPVYDTRMRSQFDFLVAKRIAKLAKENNFVALHAHTPRSVMIAKMCSNLTGLPFVYHVHSPTSRDSTRMFSNWVNQKVENWSIRSASALITVSNSLAQHVQTLGVPENLVHVVPNGVPIQPTAEKRGSKQFTLGTVALIRPRKGIEVLLESFATLVAKGYDVQLNVVGPFEASDYEKQIHDYADAFRLGKSINWIGFTKDVNLELSKMDTFVLPSLFGEGLPMVVLEAMACGIPVVATDVEGTPEAVRHLKDGLIAKSGCAIDLAEKLELFVSGRLKTSKFGATRANDSRALSRIEAWLRA